MKRLLITCILLVVALAGVLHANYIERERENDIAITEAYKNLYPETLAFDPMTHYPF
jgi:hypothetical protein